VFGFRRRDAASADEAGDMNAAGTARQQAPRATIEDLYNRFAPTIYARCRQILRDSAGAEDATQEVFSRIQDHLARIEGERQALGWLYRAATNYCLNEVRNGRTRALLLAAVPEATEADAEKRLSQRELVVRLIRDLPEDLALIAWLYHVDELEQAEIAEVCGVSRRTVIARLQRFEDQARGLLESGER
jgi:RNA polymerase sigma-70 factor (ECF subfamily)